MDRSRRVGVRCTHCSRDPIAVPCRTSVLRVCRSWPEHGGGPVHIPDGYLSPQTCAVMYAAADALLGGCGAPGPQGGQEPLRPAARARRGVLLPGDDVQRADPRRHHRARGRRGAGGGAARAVGGGDRGERRAGHPGAVLRRRRRARVRCQLLQHGDRHAVRRLRGLPDARAAHVADVAEAGARGRTSARTSASTPRRCARRSSSALQPDLFYKTSANGAHIPLYSPFHLSQTIPAMLGAHLLVAGVVEFVLTAGVIAYLQRANLPMLRINHARDCRDRRRSRARRTQRRAVRRRSSIGLGADGRARSARSAGDGRRVR